ncbi:hypothetical protein [Lyticum sinuosum]|uniref:Uncharacterized protein n=1 Tax=Lyticum sinuosum TaxID=1332059 RepID=A0AAE4VL23_9RICK|nr:hypothetical protein [Lyticum sinuosum]MDZ5761645.1 hypothetical protein [Lyticum sinuosum]
MKGFTSRDVDYKITNWLKKTKVVTRQVMQSRVHLAPSAKRKKRKEELKKLSAIMRRRRYANAERLKKQPRFMGLFSEISVNLRSSIISKITDI